MNHNSGFGSRNLSDNAVVTILCGVFFASGFSALIYQLIWQRALFSIYGVNIESITIVVAAFMLGLGLGSITGGWISKKSTIPRDDIVFRMRYGPF